MKNITVVEKSNDPVFTNTGNQIIMIHIALTTEEENKRTETGTKQQKTCVGYASKKYVSFNSRTALPKLCQISRALDSTSGHSRCE